MEVYFVISQPVGKSKRFKLTDGEYVVIGRDHKVCQVALSDDMCSNKHCKVSLTNNCVYVEDMDSKNGIYLNGIRILKQRVYHEDKLKFGDCVMYINSEKLSKEALSYLTHQGDSPRKNKGGYTLELVQKTSSRKLAAYSHKELLNEKYNENKRSAYNLHRKKSAKANTDDKLQILEMLALGIDLSFSLLIFYIALKISKMIVPEGSIPNADKLSGIDILFTDEMFFYTFISFVLSAVFFSKIRSSSGGSIGEKILKIN